MNAATVITAELIWTDYQFKSDYGFTVTPEGIMGTVAPLKNLPPVTLDLGPKAILPAWVNAHSHAFQRLLRGRTQTASGPHDNFWSWRQAMYQIATALTPESIYIVSRQVFIEMALNGIGSIGEFHYVHHQPDGSPYPNSAEMALAVTQAAIDVGLRICLLHTIYRTGNFFAPPSPLQQRFCAKDFDSAIKQFSITQTEVTKRSSHLASVGIAAHSVRAVPANEIGALRRHAKNIPLHIHVSEQIKEVDDTFKHHQQSPIALLDEHGALSPLTTLVHATHLREGDLERIKQSGAQVCFCPTTEADLGDGIGPAVDYFNANISLSLGSDGQTQTSIIAEAARLEQHSRLALHKRNTLVTNAGDHVAEYLLQAGTTGGAQALSLNGGLLAAGKNADFVAYSLGHPYLVGASPDTLLPTLIFSSDSSAVSNLFIAGKEVIKEGQHPLQAISAAQFTQLAQTFK